jgi:hypothetical protein
VGSVARRRRFQWRDRSPFVIVAPQVDRFELGGDDVFKIDKWKFAGSSQKSGPWLSNPSAGR